MIVRRLALFLGLLWASSCASHAPEVAPQRPSHVHPGDEIVVCGERFSTGGAPVVLWSEPPYYSAYRTAPRFGEDGPAGLRYRAGRAATDPELAAEVQRDGWDLERLARQVDLFVLHYDVSGTSRRCFQTLQDDRGLSVHFLLDVDGTIYQTLDLVDQAWHARQANPRSIGIEIAQIGAYSPGTASPLDRWYESGRGRARLLLPEPSGERVPGEYFAARPDRIQGTLQGRALEQYDFTPEQYVSLVLLTRTLRRVFPRIEAEVPRDAEGEVRSGVLSDDEFDAFHGILGHLHVSASKIDPGPAFQWEAFLGAVRSEGPVDEARFGELDQRPYPSP